MPPIAAGRIVRDDHHSGHATVRKHQDIPTEVDFGVARMNAVLVGTPTEVDTDVTNQLQQWVQGKGEGDYVALPSQHQPFHSILPRPHTL